MAEDYPQKGSCFGFLSRRDTLNDHLSEYRELTRESRERGRFFGGPSDWAWRPWCFPDAPILQEIVVAAGLEAAPNPKGSGDWSEGDACNAKALEVTKRVRQCAKWSLHQPGLPPEKHLEMSLEERREAFERRISVENRLLGMGQLSVAIVGVIAGILVVLLLNPTGDTVNNYFAAPTPSIETTATPQP